MNKKLILLIGTNPLPNYVLAHYFSIYKHEVDTIYFICSKGNKAKHQGTTIDHAERIIALLKKKGLDERVSTKIVLIEDIEVQQNIYNCLFSGLSEISNNDFVNFDFTGGTKFMGIHAHSFITDKFKNNARCTYLSSKSFRIMGESEFDVSDDLRKSVRLEPDELFELHGFKRRPKSIRMNSPEALEKFGDFIAKDETSEYLGDKNRKKLGSAIGLEVDCQKALVTIFESDHIDGELLAINNLLPQEFRVFDKNGSLKKELPIEDYLRCSLRFMHGDWLEDYVMYLLDRMNLGDDYKLDIDINLEKPYWRLAKHSPNFQIDNVIIRGYQLFGVSVTSSSDIPMCKNKGFELNLRTRQIGGDESKCILVTFLKAHKVVHLKEQLLEDSGHSGDNILVLGQNDLKWDNFKTKIKNFLEV